MSNTSVETRWRAAKVAVATHNVTRQFHTLRDMTTGVGVPFNKLEFAGILGEGAFGAVERRRFTAADGTSSFYAVKHLKQQDVQLQGKGSSVAARALVMMCDLAAGAAVADPAAQPQHDGRATVKVTAPSPRQSVDLSAHPEASGRADAQRSLGELVAGMSEDDRMFLAEIGVMRKLSHPYIVRYLGCGILSESQPDGAPQKHFIAVAQEICIGGSLSTTISRASTMKGKRLYAFADALRWATQCAKALQYLHESQPQVLHRDLKSENLLLTKRGRGGDVRVMDFGLMKLRKMARGGWKESEETANYTMTGVTGSFLYMAPEVVRSEAYNEKVDIFSLGIIMFELFSMYPLAKTVMETGDQEEFALYARRVASGHREPLDASWPQQIQDVIAGAWAADPQRRLSAEQVVNMLTEAAPAVQKMDDDCPRPVMAPIGVNAAAAAGSCCVIS